MGIDQYLVRIASVDLRVLLAHPSRESVDQVLARDTNQLFFSPLDASERGGLSRRLAMEYDFWALLQRHLALPDDAPLLWARDAYLPSTTAAVAQAATIGDLWMGYSPLYVLTPPQVHHSVDLLRSVSHATLTQRFWVEFTPYDDIDADEKESLCLTMLACFDDVTQFVSHAARQEEAILWYQS